MDNQRNSSSWSKFLQEFSLKVYLLSLTLLYTLLVPSIFILLLPFYLLRLFLQIIWKLFIPPEDSMIVSSRNSVLAVDNPYSPHPTSNLVICFTFTGIIDLPTWRGDMMTRLVEKKVGGILVYPQLRQYLTSSFGYFFWRKDPHFHISNHVKLQNPEQSQISLDEIMDLHLELIRRPFEKFKSPWEFILVHSNKNGRLDERRTIIFFRLHHSLSDGFSILQMLMSDIAGQPMSDPSRRENGKWKFRNILRIPYEQVAQRHFSKDVNPWHKPNLTLQRKYYMSTTPPIQVSLVREIKNLYPGSTFTSIVMTAFSAGISQYFRDNGNELDCLHTICPIPVPDRRRQQQKLGNHWSFCFVKLPITLTNSPEERLNKVNDNLRRVSESTVSRVNFTLIPFVGALPSGLIRKFGTNVFSTGITSLFSGPPDPCFWNGHLVLDACFAGGLLGGDQGICLTLISYNGNFRIVLMVDQALVKSRQVVDQIRDDIVREINILHSGNLV